MTRRQIAGALLGLAIDIGCIAGLFASAFIYEDVAKTVFFAVAVLGADIRRHDRHPTNTRRTNHD